MTGKTISSKITKTVTLGSGGYTSPLTISSSGTIDPTAYGTTGLFVPAGVTGAIIVNKGVIDGASVLTTYPSAGGIAVSLNAAATLTNSAVIVGGRGGYNDTLYGLPGGAGIDAKNRSQAQGAEAHAGAREEVAARGNEVPERRGVLTAILFR